MGACLLRASEGACVRRPKAWLLVPDANLLPERGGTKPGEFFSMSRTRTAPSLWPHRFKNSDEPAWFDFFFFFLILFFWSQVVN